MHRHRRQRRVTDPTRHQLNGRGLPPSSAQTMTPAVPVARAALFLALLLFLAGPVLPWGGGAGPSAQAASGNAITWQAPLSGPVGTRASIKGIAIPFNAGDVFTLALRPGEGQTSTDYTTICQSTSLPKVAIGEVTVGSDKTFAKQFTWPSAAGQLGAWSVCSYQTTGSQAGQMATLVQYHYFTVTASTSTPTPTRTPRPPTPTTRPAPTHTAVPTPTGVPTPASGATASPTASAPAPPMALAAEHTSIPPDTGSSGPPVGLIVIVVLVGLLLVGGGAWGAVRRRQHPPAAPPPLA